MGASIGVSAGGGRRSSSISRGMLPLLALHVASEFHRSGVKPPVTAALIIANSIVYLRPGALDRVLPTLGEVAFNPHLIVKYGDLRRFFLSAFYHVGDAHLFYNMISLLWKGIQLETSMGSLNFASMVAMLLGLSHGMTLLLSKCLYLFLDYDAYYHQYAVGFSSVLFAMKVVLNQQSSDYSSVHGIVIPTRYSVWAELILAQLLVPGVSFVGHLGGILGGLLYLKLRSSFSGPDPLAVLLGGVARIVSWPLKFVRGLFQQPRISGRGRIGRGPSARGTRGVWRCPACTYDNSPSLEICEMCSTPQSSNEFAPSYQFSGNGELSVEELRQLRLQRFS